MDINTIKKEIGIKIKKYRKSKNMTQEQFAELIDIEQASLSNIENGKTYPTFSTICNLIEKSDVEPNYLFDFLNKNKNENNKDVEIISLLQSIPSEYKTHIVEILKPVAKIN